MKELSRRQWLGSVAGFWTLTQTQAVHGGACAPMLLRAFVWTAEGETLPPDGAIILGLEPGGRGLDVPPSPFPAGIALQTPEGAIAMTSRDLGPGLRLLVPSSAPTSVVSVHGVNGPAAAPRPNGARPTVRYATTPQPLLPAPALVSVHYADPGLAIGGGIGGSGRRYTPPTIVEAQLRTPAPSDAGWLLLFASATSNAPQAFALTATQLGAERSRVVVYQSPGRCGPTIPNAYPPDRNSSVVARFLDRYGRLSPASSAVNVRGR